MFDAGDNANVFIRDMKTNQMVRQNKSPVNIETGLAIGSDKVNIYFEKADRIGDRLQQDFRSKTSPEKAKTEERQYLYPGFNDAANNRDADREEQGRERLGAGDFPGPDISHSDSGMDIGHGVTPSHNSGSDMDVGDIE